ncbi:MAG: CHRD domain-containing protein [Rhodocyclaceae bacterium]|nr:CHRD domain-containing protein [Rhodocyclaceae bacterium]
MNAAGYAALLAAALLSLPPAANADGRGHGHGRHDDDYGARLTGDQETAPVDTETRGRFRLEFNDDKSAATFRLRVTDGVRVTQAHIHCGVEGQNGPPVIFLGGFHDRGWDVDGWWVANATVTDDNIVNDSCGTTLVDIAAAMDAGMTYVNVHTVANPAGEIRGQIRRDR